MSGPFFFAWDDAGTAFNAGLHAREDEKVFSFEISQAEGELPSLSLTIKNPKIGLLAPGRKAWGWFSWFNGVEVVPLFHGRLVGIPSYILAEACTLMFIAKPVDFVDQKLAVAETLKMRPYYDPVWIDVSKRGDPDTVLEAYSALWHIDRITNAVTVSDILVGEDGDDDFHAGDAFYDSVSISLNQAPLLTINVDATVAWTQTATGTIDLGTTNFKAYSDAIVTDWPTGGDNLGAGWTVATASAVDLFGVANVQTISIVSEYTNAEKVHATGDTMAVQNSASYPVGLIEPDIFPLFRQNVAGICDPYSDPPTNTPSLNKEKYLYLAKCFGETSLTLQYDAARDRTEQLSFSLSSELQDVVTLPRDSELPDAETISLTGAGDLPIGDPSQAFYFPTDRGLWSVEYLIALARAHLIQRSRVVEVSFDCKFERAIALSCRKNARLFDARLPGGIALGKVISYSIKGDGDAGALIGNVKIGCAIGYGTAISEVVGEPCYVDDDYVDADYQFYETSVVVLPTSDIGYTMPVYGSIDDGLVFPLDRRQAVVRYEMIGDGLSPEQFQKRNDDGSLEITFGPAPQRFEIELKPVVNGPFGAEYVIGMTKLSIPKMIDLEAGALA